MGREGRSGESEINQAAAGDGAGGRDDGTGGRGVATGGKGRGGGLHGVQRRADSVVFFSSRRRHARFTGDWSSDVCSSDLTDSAIRRLAIRLHRKAGEFETAFHHTMRIAQAGEDVFEMFGEIAAEVPFPDDFLQQFEAPRIAVVAGDSEENDLFAQIGRASCRERV